MMPFRIVKGRVYFPEVHYRRGDRLVVFFGLAHVASASFFFVIQKLINHFSLDGTIVTETIQNGSQLEMTYRDWGYRLLAIRTKMVYQGDFLFYPMSTLSPGSLAQRELIPVPDASIIFSNDFLEKSKSNFRIVMTEKWQKKQIRLTTARILRDNCKRLRGKLKELLDRGNYHLFATLSRIRKRKVLITYGAGHFYAVDNYLTRRGYRRTYVRWHKAI